MHKIKQIPAVIQLKQYQIKFTFLAMQDLLKHRIQIEMFPDKTRTAKYCTTTQNKTELPENNKRIQIKVCEKPQKKKHTKIQTILTAEAHKPLKQK